MTYLQDLCSGKQIHIATHWDADGVASGALLYHHLKKHALSITTSSTGEVFEVLASHVSPTAELIICSDIKPSAQLDPHKTIYIDHHPHPYPDLYRYAIHDETQQSCSILIWKTLLSQEKDPYLNFITILGYSGDNGDIARLPDQLLFEAHEQFGHLLVLKESSFGKPYYPIELYVSLLNIGKRMHWNGALPLELLKQLTSVQDFLLNKHPLIDELQRAKMELRSLYNQPISIVDTKKIQYAKILCDKNIQGVLCSRHAKQKPLMVINERNGKIIASLRVPQDCDFDAGAFLSKFKYEGLLGGGHEKAGGITFHKKDYERFIADIEQLN
jgi:single-stranded DNA-specific DHH superfamily exonuclease